MLSCVNAANARSQFGEDQLLAPVLVRLARDFFGGVGSFVELGAVDGITHSNTLLFERCFNFTGLLIEGNPSAARSLVKSSRKAVKRHAAVCSLAGHVPFTINGGLIGGVPSGFSAAHVRKWSHRTDFNTTVDVPCFPLGAMMTEAKLPTATFLSLDVEGSEDTVLSTVNASRFTLIMFESNQIQPHKRVRLHERLKREGMRLQKQLSDLIGNSDVFVRNDVSRTVRRCLMEPSMGCGIPVCRAGQQKLGTRLGKCLRQQVHYSTQRG